MRKCLYSCVVFLFVSSAICFADNNNGEMQVLKSKVDEQQHIIEQQQATIQQLMKRMTELEAKVADKSSPEKVFPRRVALEDEELSAFPVAGTREEKKPFPVLEMGGYIDIGYVDAAGPTDSSTFINSRGDNLSTIGLGNKSTFLINEVNLNLQAHVSQKTDVIISLDVLPRDLSISSSDGTASTDNIEVRMAHVVYAPTLPSHSLTDALLGDLRISLGKFESPMGIEYRYNDSPDRVNISRSHQAIYTTGYPVGIRARGKLFKDQLKEYRNSVLVYNIVAANSDPFVRSVEDIDDNDKRTFMGRVSYGLDLFGGFFETGLSFLGGPRLGQGDKGVWTESYDGDVRFERGPLTLRAEWDYANKDRPAGGSAITFKGIYYEAFYVLQRPEWWPEPVPMISITPYYRYDTRDFRSIPVTASPSVTDLKRHTFAMRYIPWPGNIFKAEYQLNFENRGAKIDNNLFLMSYIREF